MNAHLYATNIRPCDVYMVESGLQVSAGGLILAMTAGEARKLADDLLLTVAQIEARAEVEASAA